MKYRKKPIVVEAVLFIGICMNQSQLENEAFNEYPEWLKAAIASHNIWSSFNIPGEIYIRTLEGVMLASTGDYIIQGVKGELYPCKPDIFEQTYDEVMDDDALNRLIAYGLLANLTK